MKFTVLVIDDEKNIREGLRAALELDGYAVRLAEDGARGWAEIEKGDIDAVITDLRMPGLPGEELLRRAASESPALPVIVLTGHGSIDSAVGAMRAGAYDFLTKPVNLDRLSLIVKRALSRRELEARARRMEDDLRSKQTFERIVGTDAEMQRVFQMTRRAAAARASVLITGESGVGKELIADALHNLSPRRDKPLIKVHCAALPEALLESELFGHEKGAFTGALARQRGRFELAHTGTIFLDEIGEVSQAVQVKLLRVLQDKRFERVGGEETIEVDVRTVAATNRDLKKEIAAGRFREDLYYRLNVVEIAVPPLRERRDDIPLLASSFLEECARENGKQVTGFDEKARAALYACPWPGNVRQLRNCIESAVVMCDGPVIRAEDLPPGIAEAAGAGAPKRETEGVLVPAGATMEEAERIVIQGALAQNGGNKAKAAGVLGIGRRTLYRKLEAWGIDTAPPPAPPAS